MENTLDTLDGVDVVKGVVAIRDQGVDPSRTPGSCSPLFSTEDQGRRAQRVTAYAAKIRRARQSGVHSSHLATLIWRRDSGLVRVSASMAGIAVAALVCGCDTAASPCDNAGSSSVLVLEGERRTGVFVGDLQELPRSTDTAGAEIAGCQGGEHVRVQVLEGVPRSVAVARRGYDSPGAPLLYPAEGFFLTAREHPLHRWLYRTDARPDKRRGRLCRSRPAVEGNVAAVNGWGGHVSLGSARDAFLVDVNTRLEVPSIDGVPRLLRGQRARIESQRCGPKRAVATCITAL